MVGTILMVFAFVFFVVAAAGIALPRVNLGWVGLACWALSILLGGKF